MPASLRERSANRALLLGILGLPFGILAPFAVWAGVGSLRRIRASNGTLSGAFSAWIGVVAGLVGLAVALAGTAY
jgi:hypothetical protein